MDDLTAAVRAMYEQYPYPPAGEIAMRVGSSVRVLLSYGKVPRPRRDEPLRVLDAGCGRALGLLGAAFAQPDVEFVGVDMNRVALEEARARAASVGLTNVRFVEADLMTLDGVDVPRGGFDVVVSSGVLHHLSDPATGLAKLRSVIAPHGMLSVMVYGRHGREGLYRTVRALELLAPRSSPLSERLDLARAFVRSVSSDPMFGGFFGDASRAPDAELVDRYLHVNETAYDVRGFFELLEGQRFRPLRWNEPELWDLDAVLPPGPIRQRAEALSPAERFALIEQIAERPILDLVACTDENDVRPTPDARALADATLEVHPEVSFLVETRAMRGVLHAEAVKVRRRRALLDVPRGALSLAVLALREQVGPFRGEELVSELVQRGATRDGALDTLGRLCHLEIVYAPHA